MKKNNRVRITKLSAVENPLMPTPKMEGYIMGADNGNVSIPVDYTAEVTLHVDVVVGEPIYAFRHSRNGVEIPGYFNTSVVTEINGNQIKTQNSVYIIEPL